MSQRVIVSLIWVCCTNVSLGRQYSGSISFTLLLLVNHCPLPCLRGILTLGGSLCWGILTLGGSLSFTLSEGNIDSWRITVLLGSASFTLVEGNRYSRRISVRFSRGVCSTSWGLGSHALFGVVSLFPCFYGELCSGSCPSPWWSTALLPECGSSHALDHALF